MPSLSVASLTLSEANTAVQGMAAGSFITQSIIRLNVALNYSVYLAESPRIRPSFNLYAFDSIYGYTIPIGFAGADVVPTQSSGVLNLSFDISPDVTGLSAAMISGAMIVSPGLEIVQGGMSYEWDASDVTGYTFYLYKAPIISAFNVLRCDVGGATNESGLRAKVTVAFDVRALGNGNTKALVIKYRVQGTSTWSTKTLDISALGYAATLAYTELVDIVFSQTENYDLQAVVSDRYNSATSTKSVTTAGALFHLAANKTQIAFGKFCEDGGPELDINKQMLVRDAKFFLAHVMPYCKLSAPTSESLTYNANKYLWVFDFKAVERNDDNIFNFLLGGSGGVRQMGFIIPRNGTYRAVLQVRLTGGSSSGLVGYIAKFASTWTPPAVNYQGEDTMVAAAIAANIGFLTAFSATNSWIQITYDFDAIEGEKVWPTAYARDASKTIDTENTWASIQQIG